MASDEETDAAVEYMLLQQSTHGVGCVTVKDGTMFAFGAAALRDLLKRAEASEKQSAIVFVRRQTALDKA